MEICCGYCLVELKASDLVILDHLNILFHRHCYINDFPNIKDTGTYEHIKNKYSFFQNVNKLN